MGKINEREIVYDMLSMVFKEGKQSTLVISDMLDKYAYLEKRQRAFISRLFKGTIEEYIFTDHVIGQYSSVRVNKIKLPVLLILRMSVYQITKMDHIPDSAAVNEAVKLAKKRGLGRLAGYINGVLRSIAKNKDDIMMPDQKKDMIGHLSVLYSLPEWLVHEWVGRYGAETAGMIGESFLKNRDITFRVRNTSEEALINELISSGMTVSRGLLFPQALRISGFDNIKDVAAFSDGRLTVQDEASFVPASVARLKDGMNVLDVCAAPGGKSMQMADIMHGSGLVISRDISFQKIEKIKENLERCGINNIRLQVKDAAVFYDEDMEAYDAVMADLPCSGLGVLGRKPDIKIGASEEKIEELAGLQRKILGTVQRYVKPGGMLIYSTCTISERENEQNREWFLKEFPFRPVDIDPFIPAPLRNNETKNGHIQILPHQFDTDGFYTAAFIKTAANGESDG